MHLCLASSTLPQAYANIAPSDPVQRLGLESFSDDEVGLVQQRPHLQVDLSMMLCSATHRTG